MPTAFVYPTNAGDANLVTSEQKNRIQSLLSKMFNTLSPAPLPDFDAADSHIYSWFPQDSVLVSEESVLIVEPPLLDEARESDMPAPGVLYEHLTDSAAQKPEIDGFSLPALKMERIPARRAQGGDIVAIKDRLDGKAHTALVVLEKDGQLYAHTKLSWGWDKRNLEQLRRQNLVLAAYRLNQ